MFSTEMTECPSCHNACPLARPQCPMGVRWAKQMAREKEEAAAKAAAEASEGDPSEVKDSDLH